MTIETVEDLSEQIADWLGIYGGCKNNSSCDNECTYDKNKPFCCRIGFVGAISERIREAVDNDSKLEKFELH
jgi:hypothetical protein